jgi:uncharacterized protein with von Willebrand factor type A (vWA) domain
MRRLAAAYPRLVWLNPLGREHWRYTSSVGLTQELIDERMFPLTLEGLDAAIAQLRRPLHRPLATPIGASVVTGEPGDF